MQLPDNRACLFVQGGAATQLTSDTSCCGVRASMSAATGTPSGPPPLAGAVAFLVATSRLILRALHNRSYRYRWYRKKTYL